MDAFELIEGHYLVGNQGIYKVQEFLGQGNFGKVAKCTKLGSPACYAIKIMKGSWEGEKEFKMMKVIKDLDPDENHLIKMYEWFPFQNMTCIVYELLEINLLDFLMNKKQLAHLSLIRVIAQQLLKALKALKSIGVAHCDIKMDNIMFTDPASANLKLIDFGLAVKTKKLSTGTEIQVTPFRAPEVILGLPLDESVDMWALGVVLACVYFGNYPFPVETEYETIRAMVQIFGSPEAEVLRKAKYKGAFFTRDNGNWRLCTPEEYTEATGEQVETDHVINLEAMIQVRRRMFKDHDDDDHRAFIDLLKSMLEVNPQNRITPSQALEHDFITMKHLAGESKAKYAGKAEQLMEKTPLSEAQVNPSASSSSSMSGFSNKSLKSSMSDGEIVDDTGMSEVSSAGSEDEQSSHSSDSPSSREMFSESLESLVSDGEIVDVTKFLSSRSEDEQSSHSSLNSSSSDSCEKPVFQENLEKTKNLQTDKDKAKRSREEKKEIKYFGVKKGQLLVGSLGTYRVEKFLGEGAFGKVTKCSKLGSEEMFAIKILENVNEGKEELEAMKLIEDLDPDENNLIKFYECFSHKNVICLVYEILDECLSNCFEVDDPTDLCNIRAIALQMFQALHALKSVGVVHGDIKMDNIMFAEEESLRIKLIDFGFAMKAKNLMKGTNIQVTPFRAPEVILGLPLDESIDMWGLGVVLASLYYGNYPFPSETEYETIRAMVQIFGLPEEDLLNAGDFTEGFFTWDDDGSTSGWRLLTPDEYTQDTGEELEDVDHVMDLDQMTEIHKEFHKDHDDDDQKAFIDLLKRMLEVNPQNRITPSQALEHDFITMKHLAGESKAKYAGKAEELMGQIQLEEKKKKT